MPRDKTTCRIEIKRAQYGWAVYLIRGRTVLLTRAGFRGYSEANVAATEALCAFDAIRELQRTTGRLPIYGDPKQPARRAPIKRVEARSGKHAL